MEVNCTDPTPSARIPWLNLLFVASAVKIRHRGETTYLSAALLLLHRDRCKEFAKISMDSSRDVFAREKDELWRGVIEIVLSVCCDLYERRSGEEGEVSFRRALARPCTEPCTRNPTGNMQENTARVSAHFPLRHKVRNSL